MLITLIAAVSEDGFIAQNRRIPWRLPRDIQHFREYCAGKTLLVGRRTFEEMNGWFQNHFPLILTRRGNYSLKVGRVVRDVGEALEVASERGVAELVVLGGGEVFAAVWPLARRLLLTQVETMLGQGTRFPVNDFSGWREISAQYFPADDAHAFAFTIRELSHPTLTHHAT